MLLDKVIVNRKLRPPKGIINGPPAIGKTPFGASAPNSILLDCENGAGLIQSACTPYLQTWIEIDKWLQELVSTEHDYKLVVIDTLDWLMRRLEEHVSGASVDEMHTMTRTLNRSHGGYGNGKQVLKNFVYQRLLPTLDMLTTRGIGVLLLAHARRVDVTDIEGVTITKTTADLNPDYLRTFSDWADFVCTAIEASDGKRVLITRENDRVLASNRYGLPSPIPFDWKTFQSEVSRCARQWSKTTPQTKKG